MDKHYVVKGQGVRDPNSPSKEVERGSVIDQEHYDAIIKKQPLAHRWLSPIEAGSHPALPLGKKEADTQAAKGPDAPPTAAAATAAVAAAHPAPSKTPAK
jgi:hypothetical protein